MNWAALAAPDASKEQEALLEEVIVTAQKRGATDLHDTALSAAVVTSDQVELRKLVSMQDFLRTTPGATHLEYGAGRTTTVIRGISADPQEGVETTGTYINETPLTGAGDFGISSPELKLVDIDRVEILRGPQGTLFGSSSLGGTVRVITAAPDAGSFGGHLTGSLSSTAGAGSGNFDLLGVFNVPLIEDELALRIVGYSYDNSGYYENVAGSDPIKGASAAATGALALDRDDVGASTYQGGRLALRWTPTDDLGIDLMVLQQQIEQEGVGYGDLRIGEFQQARYTRVSTGRSEYTQDDLTLWNLAVEYDFDQFSLASYSSWIDYQSDQDWDVGQFWTFLYGDDAPVFILNNTRTDSFVQEVRLASQWDYPVNFLAGLYYEDRDQRIGQVVEWDGRPEDDPLEGALIFEGGGMGRFEQRALFSELSWDVNNAVTATLGVRRFEYETRLNESGTGLVVGGEYASSIGSRESGYTYKANLSWTPDDDSLYYAQWADGFNPGFPVGEFPANCDVDGDGLLDGIGLPAQDQVDSDFLDSYEIGSKQIFANGRVDVRGALYYNDWQGIPILLVADCAVGFPFNAAEAMTAGVELEGSARIDSQWRLDFNLGYTKAQLTTDAPGLGADGDRLPGTPEYNAALGVQYDFAYRGRDGYFRADLSRVGGFYNNLQEQGEEIGDYTTLDLTAGLAMGNWELQAFVKNLGDSSAPTWLYAFDQYPSAYRLRPRTAGVTARFRFGALN